MKYRDVIKLLEADGWFLERTVGSHLQFRHPNKPGTVTVPSGGKYLSKNNFVGQLFQADRSAWKS